ASQAEGIFLGAIQGRRVPRLRLQPVLDELAGEHHEARCCVLRCTAVALGQRTVEILRFRPVPSLDELKATGSIECRETLESMNISLGRESDGWYFRAYG